MTEPPSAMSGRAEWQMAASEKALTSWATRKSSRVVATNWPSRAARGA